jgi:hypothetical protein
VNFDSIWLERTFPLLPVNSNSRKMPCGEVLRMHLQVSGRIAISCGDSCSAFFVGFIMLVWVWMPTVPHKQKLGILTGISFQLAEHVERRMG